MHFSRTFALSFIIAITLLLLNGCTSNTTSSESNEPDPALQEATITLDNNGANSYSVLSVDGNGVETETGTENPDIRLSVGGRYTFINRGGASSHPLDFRNSDRNKLLGQSNNSGLFDDDSSVNVQTEGDAITFTLTEELANQIADYICSFHPGMNGSVIVSSN